MSTDTTPPEGSDRSGLLAFGMQLVLSLAAVAAGLFMAGRYMTVSLEHQRLERSAVRQSEAADRGALYVRWLPGELPRMEPWSDAWIEAPAVELPLQAQRVAMPMLDEISIPSVTLQGLTDGQIIAWRVVWPDPNADTNVDVGRFTDAVALQFPLDRQAHFTMGKEGERVQILHWKSLWQADVDEHFQDVQDLHPNYWADLYWFAKGSAPYRVPDSFGDPRSHAWFAAYAAGNPMSDFLRTMPVEELTAEGYGSLTSQPDSVTAGRGEWRDGRWSVVFARPLRSEDPLDRQFWRGGRGNVAVAVWDGSAGNVGGRKHWTNWVVYEVSP